MRDKSWIHDGELCSSMSIVSLGQCEHDDGMRFTEVMHVDLSTTENTETDTHLDCLSLDMISNDVIITYLLCNAQFELGRMAMSIQFHQIFIKCPFLLQTQCLTIQFVCSTCIFDGVMYFLLHISTQDEIGKIS